MGTELPDVEVMDVFVLDDHGRLRLPPPIEPRPELRHAAHGAVRQLQDVKATPGHRLGSDPGTIMRTGVGEEIVQPVLVPADDAWSRLEDPSLFVALPRLTIDVPSRRDRGSTATWRSRLDTGLPRGERDAVLRIRPTPTRTIMIIELVPARPRRLRTNTFVRLGVQAVAELGSRLRVG